MKAVSIRAQETLGEFNAQDLANAAWAFAKLAMREESLMKAVSSRARDMLGEFKAQGLANTVWALARTPTFRDVPGGADH